MTPDEVLAFDRDHVWHPYAPATRPTEVRLVEGARGVRLSLAGVGEVIDGMSSWWAAIHGYRHPELDAALSAQAGVMSHVMFGGLTHRPATTLVRHLLDLVGPPMAHVFLCDSGSVSVEVAVKLCLQYHRGHGRDPGPDPGPGTAGRHRFLTVRGGYHGDTSAAMSLCDPVNGMHSMFTGSLVEQVFAPRPPAGFDLPDDHPQIRQWTRTVEGLARDHAGDLAGIVVEPVLQGAGGMHVYSPACLRALRRVADGHGLPLVFDEIATGFGRTGVLFAADHAGVRPDIMCVGKALTGGYLTLAAVLCTAEVAEAVDASDSGALMHGPTFMANPLACAVAAANLDIIGRGHWVEQVRGISGRLTSGLAGLRHHPAVAEVRVLGAVGVVQTRRPVDVPAVTRAALDHGVWLRPFRDLIYTMPPYLCTPGDVDAITGAMAAAAEVMR